jgi:uncharacterized membrane protein (UPF0127 family)
VPTAEVRIRFGPDRALAAEVADEKGEWGRGLMFRRNLDRDAGMLFVFPYRLPAGHGFIMENVRIPLSTAFLERVDDRSYKVVAILEMDPCPPGTKADTPECPEYEPGVAYDAAVEANGGWFREAAVAIGDRATVEPLAR